MSIQEQRQKIEAIIGEQAGNRPVTLIAVTKYATIEQMKAAYEAGIRDFGENKVQDALVKQEAFPQEQFPGLKWHLIGSLQSNKAKKTVGRFSLIHAVDALALAQTLSRQNEAAGTKQDILLQVNMSEDPNRHGWLPERLFKEAPELVSYPGIVLRGVMAMAPPEVSLSSDEAAIRAYFSQVAHLRDELQEQLGIALPELSMGMSHDFPHALYSGATIIRIGNYLFKT